MGEVWRARDTRLDRDVAIKILPAEFANNAQFQLRFEREARAISQLNHPNICTLYDVGDSFLVMELLEGETLAQRLTRGPLSLVEALRYGMQIAQALDRAHRAGIVHRDLKPGNVMITRTGAKLLDFGLAKSVSIVSGDGATVQKPLTQEGTILGTFQYMAPEQLEGEEADARTDVFALGALLYEMATGRRAFEGKTKTSLIAAIVTGQPQPMTELVPLTPPAFEHVVKKCLAKDREERWQSAYDIAEELRWIGEAGSQAGAVQSPSRRMAAIPLFAAVMLALGIAAFATRSYFQQAPKQYRLTIPSIDADFRGGTIPVISPDGQTIYFMATSNDNKRLLFRRGLNDFRAVPVEGTEGNTSVGVTIAPDSRTLVIGFGGGVYKRISADGGPLETVGVVDAASGVAIASDGTLLVGSSTMVPIRRVWPNGKVEPLFTLDKAAGELGHRWPVFLPDRKRFGLFRESPRYLFLSGTSDAQGTIHYTLCASTLGSKAIKRIGEVPSQVQFAVGHLFFVRQGTLMAQPFDADSLTFSGDAVPVMNEIGFGSRAGVAFFSVASDGTIVAGRAVPASHLTWVDQAGRKAGTVGSAFSAALTIGGMGTPRIRVSPRGDRAVLGLFDPRAGTVSLWIHGLTRETANRMTLSPASELNPVVTPDGSRVFFASDAQSAWDVFEAAMDGGEAPKPVYVAPNFQAPTDVSADGRFLAFTSNANLANQQDIFILPLTGGKAFPFLATAAAENQGVFSPDGKWMAYVSNPTGATQVYVRPFPGPGAARPVSTKGGIAPRFSADGKRIYFLSGNKVFAADWSDGNVGEPKLLFELSDRIQLYEAVGDRFLMVLLSEADAAPPSRVIVNWRPPKKIDASAQ